MSNLNASQTEALHPLHRSTEQPGRVRIPPTSDLDHNEREYLAILLRHTARAAAARRRPGPARWLTTAADQLDPHGEDTR